MADNIYAVVESERAKMSDEDFLKKCFAKKVWTKGLKKNELIRFNYLRNTPSYWAMMPAPVLVERDDPREN